MQISVLSQPPSQLGNEFDTLLDGTNVHRRIVFVSAFVALRTVLRMRDRLLQHQSDGTSLRLVVGIDLGGTSREVLEELLRWNCEVFVFHNPIVRATFHPKVYLFEGDSNATLIIGSNNLTDGGLFTNYEAATKYEFRFPQDAESYESLNDSLSTFLTPNGPTVQRLSRELLDTLIVRGQVSSENEARQQRREQLARDNQDATSLPENPFTATNVPRAPLLPPQLRNQDTVTDNNEGTTEAQQQAGQQQPLPIPTPQRRVLAWRKKLPQTDALQVNPGSHHVGGVRLTQARFENPPGHRIDQTTYFRQLFNEFQWEREPRGHRDQEHTFVPIRIIILGADYGIRQFEISHKPSGEAGQDNYTTILRWGMGFNHIIERSNLTNKILSLYEIADPNCNFLIEITDQ